MLMSMSDPLSRKRTLGDQEDHLEIQMPTTKKLKDDEFNEKIYGTYVKNALEQLEKNNDSNQLEALTVKINLPTSNAESITIPNFKIVLKNLIANISKLDNDSCNQLIIVIIGYNWLKVDDVEFKEIYCQFLLVLISSIPNYLFKVLNKIVSEFKDCNQTSNEIHHKILQNIIKFNPTVLNKFPSVFQKNFPHHIASDQITLNNYILNILTTLSYCQELQYDIWLLIVECCIKLDVELQNDLDDLDDEDIDALINGAEDEDAETDDEGQGDNMGIKEDEPISDTDMESDPEIESDGDDEDQNIGQEEYLMDPTTTTKDIQALVNKLDSIIHLLLQNTSESFTTEKIANGSAIHLFNTLTSLFRSHILPTHFTKLIQFLLFHISQYQTELVDSFLVSLIDIAFNPSQVLETRLKSMQYLSSYIARAKNISKNQIVFVVSYLVGWLNKYIQEREFEIGLKANSDKNVGGMERFKLFYSTFQGLLYVFCFRYNSLQLETKKGDIEWECEIDKFFQRVIITKFNPLKFIDETVCFIFAKIATKLNVCYCYSIIEQNKRERMLSNNGKKAVLPSTVGNFKQKQEFLDLEAYFPFDPLVLPLSKKMVHVNYIEWSQVNPNQDEDDDEDSGNSSTRLSSSSDNDDSESESDNESDEE